MKTAVISNTNDGMVLSTAMEDLQNYYDITVLPTRPRSPKDKASVERHVRILEEEFISEIKDRTFESFHELNMELKAYLEKLNNRLRSKEKYSRRELFEMYDRPQMRPLPESFFVYRDYRQFTVSRNCYIEYKKNHYSVPFQYVGQKVIAKISMFDIVICDMENREICRHGIEENDSKRYVTVDQHMKSSYQKARQLEIDGVAYYLNWTEKIGPNMRAFIQDLIGRSTYPEQSYGLCDGVLHLCKGYPNKECDELANELLDMYTVSYTAFKKALIKMVKERKLVKTGAVKKKTSSKAKKKDESELPDHDNIRGEDYYS